MVRGPVLFGLFFGLCLLKFGNPPIMEKFVDPPKGAFDALIITPWPLHWAYWLLGCLTLLAFCSSRFRASLFGFLSSFVIRLPRRIFGAKAGHSSFTPGHSSLQFDRPSPLSLLTYSLPLLWLAWQFLSSCLSISHDLSTPTVIYYTACVVCFYFGLFFLSSACSAGSQQSNNPTIQQSIRLWPFWLGIFCGFILVIAIGLDQHFGGLQEARNYLYRRMELYPDKQFPPEFIKRMARNRIYSTLFYPNTLAGALLLFSPSMLLMTVRLGDRWRLGNASRFETILVLVVLCLTCLFLYLLNTHVGWLLILLLGLSLIFPVPRWVAPTILAVGILAVLFWSGSKAGWLLMLLLALIVLMQIPPAEPPGKSSSSSFSFSSSIRFFLKSRAIKSLLLAFLLLAGLTGFFLRYSTFFKTGATSVSARFDYWRAAVQIAKSHPLFGTGPGTFQIPYEKIKRPEAEMARLTHNDYLQQASDSGIPGFLLYTFFIATALLVGGRNVLSISSGSYSSSASSQSPPSLLGFLSSLDIRHSLFEFAVWLGLLAWAAQCLVEFSLQIPALAWPAFTLLGYLISPRFPETTASRAAAVPSRT